MLVVDSAAAAACAHCIDVLYRISWNLATEQWKVSTAAHLCRLSQMHIPSCGLQALLPRLTTHEPEVHGHIADQWNRMELLAKYTNGKEQLLQCWKDREADQERCVCVCVCVLTGDNLKLYLHLRRHLYSVCFNYCFCSNVIFTSKFRNYRHCTVWANDCY